jgi:hypothetical protein
MPARTTAWAPPRWWWVTHRWIEQDEGEQIVRRLVCLGRWCPRHGQGEVVEEVFLDRETRRVIGLGTAGDRK